MKIYLDQSFNRVVTSEHTRIFHQTVVQNEILTVWKYSKFKTYTVEVTDENNWNLPSLTFAG